MVKYNYSTLLSTHCTRNAAVSCTSRPLHHFRDGIAICQVATKRANRGWARWGKTVQPVPLTSSYSSLQGADRYSAESVIQRPHGEVTKGGFPITHPSQVHAVSRHMPWKGGANMREQSMALVSVTAGMCQPCRAGFLLEREGREKRPTSHPLGLAPHWLNSPCVLLFARPKEGLLALWFLASRSHETQKTHLLLNHP
jgi:hypothetical protein